jgi:excisionase family DNA binding protein
MIKDKYLSTSEAAKLLGFVPAHVRRLILEGDIKAEKVGQTWMILPKAIMHIKRLRNNKSRNEHDRSD